MSQTLEQIAQKLHATNKKVQLIYAFNGTGKTRLSRALKKLIVPRTDGDEEEDLTRRKILYYSAFTEDLFYWDNDLLDDSEPKLKIQPNEFTDWVLRDRGQDRNIVDNFQRYTSRSITPNFVPEELVIEHDGRRENTQTFPEIRFNYTGGDDVEQNVKISKGEESNLIWSVFYAILQEAVSILQEKDPALREDEQFDDLQIVFIDDPVSSLDDPHLIELAVDLAQLIKSCESSLRFIITTHNPLFYNVLHNELKNSFKKERGGELTTVYRPSQAMRWRLEKLRDGRFLLIEQDSRTPFSYHLLLISELKKAIDAENLQKYHFNFLRNVLEKTATFLGYQKWGDLLPQVDGAPDPFAARIVNLSSHSAHSGEEISEPDVKDKEKLVGLVNYLFDRYHFLVQEAEDG
ncbi:AAA family ATPase [Altericroceibacterium endophyticum]|uniref:AAA family ATPase n=1 Tax=Altericroceibacterium endophyticum TaxID=1808508 RepID=A0A6I4T8X6_9SPHN|nr:AAA family ATPase [Altericroceibacterium endophyticum]MXO66581.1 AAA family ATPase [Altericroceibacterium endophyticum]